MNNVSLVGRLSKDPIRKEAKNGVAVTMFQLCVERGVRTTSGEKVVDWIPCTAFAIPCEYICKYAHKGDMLSVIGKIQTRTARDENNSSIFIVEVVINAVNILNPKPQVQTVAPQSAYPNPGYNNNQNNNNYELDDEDHQGVPF